MSGTLYIVATPIGNLQDITARAIATLQNVDFILAEDTRVTLKLLNHYEISKKVISYDDHASDEKNAKILEELQEGRSYALVSDAGTPAVSDPGAKLVRLARDEGVEVIPIVGPSSVTAIMSVFGEASPYFHFWGFWPKKNKKKTELLQYFSSIPGVHVFFESPYRLLKVLERDFLSFDCWMLVGREITKKFESYYSGTPAEIFDKLQGKSLKGELVVALQCRESHTQEKSS